ncbi:hypothetical protein GE09DRAFT_1134217 [Coniochaeta sp. 2T2.1]|nr:hypothetical protein GE09DRAFT_1134217 [Coniochaeta sp. 2T2.1]
MVLYLGGVYIQVLSVGGCEAGVPGGGSILVCISDVSTVALHERVFIKVFSSTRLAGVSYHPLSEMMTLITTSLGKEATR